MYVALHDNHHIDTLLPMQAGKRVLLLSLFTNIPVEVYLVILVRSKKG